MKRRPEWLEHKKGGGPPERPERCTVVRSPALTRNRHVDFQVQHGDI